MMFGYENFHGLQSAKPFFISSIGVSLTDRYPPKGNLLHERQSETAPMLFPFWLLSKSQPINRFSESGNLRELVGHPVTPLRQTTAAIPPAERIPQSKESIIYLVA